MRWWDGTRWTEHVTQRYQPAAAGAPAAHQPETQTQPQTAGGQAVATAPSGREVRAAAKADVKRRREDAAREKEAEYEAGLRKRLDDVLSALAERDIVSASGFTHHLEAYAVGRRGRKGLEAARQRLASERAKLDVSFGRAIGEISSEGFWERLGRTEKFFATPGTAVGGTIRIFEDRIEQDGSAHWIDEHTQAQVYVDGQKQITTRPTLTALALFSPLPGSSIGPALARPKQKTHDLRVAEFQVVGPDWSFSVAISPDRSGVARALASRINAIADRLATQKMQESALEVPPATTSAPNDIVGQIERISELQRSGTITAEQADILKKRLIEGV